MVRSRARYIAFGLAVLLLTRGVGLCQKRKNPDITIRGEITSKRICLNRTYTEGKKALKESYGFGVTIRPIVKNTGDKKLRLQGYEVSADCALAKSLELAKEDKYFFQWNSDTFYPVGYEPPQLLEHQIGIRGRVLQPAGEYALPAKAARCGFPLSFEPIFDVPSVGTYYLTFHTTLQIYGLPRKNFPIVAADPIEMEIPAKARTVAGRLKSRMNQSPAGPKSFCEDLTE